MKKILITIAIFFYTILNLQAQTNAVSEDSLDNGAIFTKVEVEATFPGGTEGWKQYLMKNLKADIPVNNRARPGTYQVIVQFIVGKDGSISNVTPLTNFGYGMEKEVVRVIKKGPKWLPATQNGNIVKAYRKQPVTFIIE
jgi:periplasmic protein TonB